MVVKTNLRNIRCVDKPLQLLGNYHSVKAKSRVIAWEPCNPEFKTCKSIEEIRAFADKTFIMFFHNKNTFSNDGFGPETLLRQVKVNFIPLLVDFPTQNNYNLQIT